MRMPHDMHMPSNPNPNPNPDPNPRQVYRLCDTLVDDVVCVSDGEIREAIRDGFEDTRALLEPAGALTCSLWLRLLTIGCAYLLWLCLLLMAVLTRRLLGGGT